MYAAHRGRQSRALLNTHSALVLLAVGLNIIVNVLTVFRPE
jgi:hypothetical protein